MVADDFDAELLSVFDVLDVLQLIWVPHFCGQQLREGALIGNRRIESVDETFVARFGRIIEDGLSARTVAVLQPKEKISICSALDVISATSGSAAIRLPHCVQIMATGSRHILREAATFSFVADPDGELLMVGWHLEYGGIVLHARSIDSAMIPTDVRFVIGC